MMGSFILSTSFISQKMLRFLYRWVYLEYSLTDNKKSFKRKGSCLPLKVSYDPRFLNDKACNFYRLCHLYFSYDYTCPTSFSKILPDFFSFKITFFAP